MSQTPLLQLALHFQPQCPDQECKAEAYEKLTHNFSATLLTSDPDGNHYLWLGSDETYTVERLTFSQEAQQFIDHQHIHIADFVDLPDSDLQEIDIEGFDYENHYLWVVGSHSKKRKKPKPEKSEPENIKRLKKVEFEADRYLLARIPLVGGQLHRSCPHPDAATETLTAAHLEFTPQGNQLMTALAKDDHLGPFIRANIPGKDNGFDIEGIAVRQNRILLGLRGPVLRGWAMILEIEIEQVSSTSFKLKPGPDKEQYRKHFINLNGLGIRDLCLYDQDLLILAGPTMDLDGPVQLFQVKNGLNSANNSLTWEPQLVMQIPFGNGTDHAEGFTLFEAIAQRPSILVVYDSPAPERRINSDNGILADLMALA